MRIFLVAMMLVSISAGAQDYVALRAAIEDLSRSFPDTYPNGADYLKRLEACEKGAPGFQALQREALVANPLVKDRLILFVSRAQYKPDHHNTETMFQTGEINTASFAGGGALKVIDFAQGGKVTTLLEVPEGIARDPEVHFDGDRIVFSMRRDIRDDYHIYELSLSLRAIAKQSPDPSVDAGSSSTGDCFAIARNDGNLRQLTFAPGVSDIDPLYLPDDSIAFSSTREPKYCMCNRHIMCNLYRMDFDGANIVQIGKSTLFEGQGALMPDGRILYNRWEYVDRNFGDGQGLWTVNPDGTNHAVYWGNNTVSPGAVIHARPIPGTQQAICIFGSCHDRPWGAVAIIDRRLALDGKPAVIRTWPKDAINLVGNDPAKFNFDTFTQVNPKYEDPFPLSDKYFLCSRMTGNGEQMGIYLIDVFGNETLLCDEAPGCFDPMPLGPMPRPPAIPTRRDFENKDGYFYVADVYRGTHMEGVKPGAVKSLRVIESPEKRYWTTPPWNGQGQEAPAMNWHDFNNKRILGTVPVEADGSAYFAVPADTFVYFQLLDADGMMIQSMRSGTIVQSGEKQGCVGCHEERRTSAPTPNAAMPLALRREPSTLDGWHGPARLFDYMKEVQPVFDRRCNQCHDYGKSGAEKLILAGDTDMCFNTSYNELWRKKYITVIGAGIGITQPAYSWGAHASKIVERVRRLHELDGEDLDRLITWIDLNAPFYPSYASAFPNNLAGRNPLDNNSVKRLSELTGVPFADLMDFSKNRGPQVCFERPELSPCLKKFTEKDTNYCEAVSIIGKGKEALAKSGAESVCSVDQHREEKYVARHAIELRNREAIRAGQKMYDK